MSNHDLENMIFNLEERKDLKKVELTQKAVVEVLGYLYQLRETEKILQERILTPQQIQKIAKETVQTEFNKNMKLIKQEIRKQVCDEIREKTQYKYLWRNVMEEIIDQVEKGDEQC